MPRSAIIWTRSRKLSLNVMYHLTHRMMISWSKCRPLNRSCAEVGSFIPAVIARYQAFQQFAPEPLRQRPAPTTIVSRRFDHPSAATVSGGIIRFAKRLRLFDFARCGRQESHVTAHAPEMECTDRIQSDAIAFNFRTGFSLLNLL